MLEKASMLRFLAFVFPLETGFQVVLVSCSSGRGLSLCEPVLRIYAVAKQLLPPCMHQISALLCGSKLLESEVNVFK